MINSELHNCKNIREFISGFYSIYPDIRAKVNRLLPNNENVNYAENPFVDIEAIARDIGINNILYISPEFLKNKHSFLFRDGVILLNSSDSKEEQRFSIAHEIAHFLMEGDSKNSPIFSRTIDKQWDSLKSQFIIKNEAKNDNISRGIKLAIHEEMELAIGEEIADYFAVNLLVPTDRFILWKNHTDTEIAKAFKVSVECIKKRRIEIKDEISLIEPTTMSKTISITRGSIVGIGKVKIPKTKELNQEIQLLSFLDIKKSENLFISTCIHLRIDGYGETAEEAEEDMVENVYYFLCQNFKNLSLNDAWENLKMLLKSDEWSSELWDAYHEAQIQLSISGKTTDNIISLLERLKSLEDRVKELEKQVLSENLKETRINLAGEIRKLAKDLIVDKTYFKEADAA
ncbi:ImmA/IrrE family metallo-endopeptidase [Treponema sp. R80B11-R83G3]